MRNFSLIVLDPPGSQPCSYMEAKRTPTQHINTNHTTYGIYGPPLGQSGPHGGQPEACMRRGQPAAIWRLPQSYMVSNLGPHGGQLGPTWWKTCSCIEAKLHEDQFGAPHSVAEGPQLPKDRNIVFYMSSSWSQWGVLHCIIVTVRAVNLWV